MSTAAASASAPAAFNPRVLSAFVLPLYFVLLMAATLVTALHAPAPHDLALTIAGPSATTSKIAAGIERAEPSSFDVTQVTTDTQARTAVLRRDAVGAVVIGGTATAPTVTTYVASGGGRSAEAAVEAVGTRLGTQLGTTAKVVDLAPLVAEDGLGTGTFYLVTFSSIGGYLTLIVLTQVVPRARLSRKYLTAAAAGVLVPIVVFGLSSIFIDFELSFGALMAVLGVLALYVFTLGLIVIMAEQLIGRAAIFLVAPLAIFLNLPSAGGASPESMLPGFWQAIHSFWVGAGANEAIRDIVYFAGGANPVRWILQILVWTLALLVVTLFINGIRLIWRLQSVVIRTQRHSDSLSEHLQLMNVPQQPKQRAAITSGPAATSAAAAPISESAADDHADEPTDARPDTTAVG